MIRNNKVTRYSVLKSRSKMKHERVEPIVSRNVMKYFNRHVFHNLHVASNIIKAYYQNDETD